MTIHKLLFLLFAAAFSLLLSCTDTTTAQTLRSLQGSGAVSFVCVGPDGRGRDIDGCPDFDREGNRLLALVTQTITGEVAVVDLSRGQVVDVQPAVPGFSFLPVGARPVDIVSTPDGEASFVGVAEFGKTGIFALPTSCVGPPEAFQSARDLTSWSACALDSAPGDMTIVIDPPLADGSVRGTCDGTLAADVATSDNPERKCRANLTNRKGGRRKLVVALPDEGQLGVIDAQWLLNQEPGTFVPCLIERKIPLLPSRPLTVEQPLPADLQQEGCTDPLALHSFEDGSFQSRPAGLAQSGADLFVGDQGAPVIHRVDLSDPCAPVSKPPLLPVSLQLPERVVTTTRLAVSPPTTQGKQFLYAIDEKDPRGSSVMVFDVSLGATSRAPLVRPGTPRTPFESPDRIAFSSAVQDIAFVLQDLPISDAVGTAAFGTLCDPVDNNSLGAAYRPSRDLSRGAGPNTLRGIFGLLLLTSGQIVVIDVEDFDAPCRRPVETNKTAIEDFRGCANDPEGFPDSLSIPETGLPTVSDEVSCRVIEPHRARSQNFLVSRADVGVGAPSLRAFPRLTGPQGELATNLTDAGRRNPKLLPVDYPDPYAWARVFVGTTLFENREMVTNPLRTDPAFADRSALTLPWNTPRSYPPDEEVAVTYEGVLSRRENTGFLRFLEGGSNFVKDSNALFCDAGVQDIAVMRLIGQERFRLEGEALEKFARLHADYLQITGDLPEADHPHWSLAGATCGGEGIEACRRTFGDAAERSLDPNRDLTILQAFQDRLVVEPRANPAMLALLDCCFPGGVSYAVRAGRQWLLRGSASGFRHNIVAERRDGENGEPEFACVRDCDPRKRFFVSRAFEISSSTCEVPADEEELPDAGCSVGPSVRQDDPGKQLFEDLVCTYDHQLGSIVSLRQDMPPNVVIPECIFENLTARFAIYRGLEPSKRDMTFNWQTTGGFRALAVNLTLESASVLPQQLRFVPQLGQVAVVDGAALGLSFVSLETLLVLEPIYF